MIYAWGVAIYFIAMTMVFIIGFSQGSWLDTANHNPKILSFRKPAFYRLGSGMFSLLCLAGVVFLVISPANSPKDFADRNWALIPFLLLFAYFMAYVAGPDDVSIDIETRVCQQTRGWMFHPRKRFVSLSETSYVCAVSGSKSYYVNLMIGDSTDLRFLIARPSRMSDAVSLALEIADKLHLPAKELTSEGLRNLS